MAVNASEKVSRRRKRTVHPPVWYLQWLHEWVLAFAAHKGMTTEVIAIL